MNEGKVNLTPPELVVKLDEIKFGCKIISKFGVIDRMKIQKGKFSQKRGMLKYRTRLGICMSRGGG